MQSFLKVTAGLLSVAVILSVHFSVKAEQYVLGLAGTGAFCRNDKVVDPNCEIAEGDDIRLAYKCTRPYDVSFIEIEYFSTSFGGCFVTLFENNNLCYTTQLHHHGKGMTIKAEPCYDFPGQQLWNFINVADSDTPFPVFTIHPKGRLDLCLTSVHTLYRRGLITTPLSIESCYTGNDTSLAMRDQWGSECVGNSFRNFTCSDYDPSQLCQVEE